MTYFPNEALQFRGNRSKVVAIATKCVITSNEFSPTQRFITINIYLFSLRQKIRAFFLKSVLTKDKFVNAYIRCSKKKSIIFPFQFHAKIMDFFLLHLILHRRFY